MSYNDYLKKVYVTATYTTTQEFIIEVDVDATKDEIDEMVNDAASDYGTPTDVDWFDAEFDVTQEVNA